MKNNSLRQLRLIIKNEYLTDIKNKRFWIATLVFPLIIGIFSFFIGILAEDSTSLQALSNPSGDNMDDFTIEQVISLVIGMLLTLFIMIYGAQIYSKVKVEKCNRIIEILATSVDGKTMMMAKIISVALIGLTQIFLWCLLLFVIIGGLILILVASQSGGDSDFISTSTIITTILISILYFIGGYLLYGSLYAATGAMTDRNDENQEYMSILTFILLATFYIGQYTVENSSSALAQWCEYIPFTSPTVGAINAVSGAAPWWQTMLSLFILYASAFLSISISGKIYRSSLLLMGKKFSPKDIVTFIKTK